MLVATCSVLTAVQTSQAHVLILLTDAAEDDEQPSDLECLPRVLSSQRPADRSELSSRPADVGGIAGRSYWQVSTSLQACRLLPLAAVFRS